MENKTYKSGLKYKQKLIIINRQSNNTTNRINSIEKK